TPGAPNALGRPAFAADPVPSLESGAYTNDSLTLTLAVPADTTVHYTLDGSVPTIASLPYNGPLSFATNVTIKARAYQAGVLPTRVVARTFVLLDPTPRDFTSTLPLMILSTSGRAIGEYAPGLARTPGALMVFDATSGQASFQGPPQF